MIKSSPIAAVSATFACRLFTTLAERSAGENVFVSPASVALALAMLHSGARGETQRALANVLDLGGADADDLNQASAALQQQLARLDDHIKLSVANALWVSENVRLDDDFARTTERCYDAAIRSLDFAHQPAARIINGWVEEHTNGKIERIVEQVDRDTLLMLVNAIYFKGEWTEPFNRQLTQDGPFTLAGGQQVQHPMMAQRGRFRYLEDRAFQAVALPYGGGRVCMYIFLPRGDLADFTNHLSGKRWESWMSHFSSTEGRLVLPRFRAEYEAKLNDALKSLGMGIAFDQRADFGAMVDDGERLRIDEVRHKTFVEVNEEGTEAAAVTSVGMMRASFAPKKTFSMVVDRPFFCAIRDERSGTILFMGAINNPS